MEIDEVDAEKMRVVEVVSKSPGVSFKNTAYDQGEDLYTFEDGLIKVQHVAFYRHPRAAFQSEWKSVLPDNMVQKVIVKDWADKEVLDERAIDET